MFRDKFILSLSYSLKTEHKKYLKESGLSKHTTFDEIFYSFNLYWDYLNYNLLEVIIENHGRPILQKKMRQFTIDVESFRKSTTVKVFKKIDKYSVIFEPEGFRCIVTKHDISPDATLEDVHNLRLRLAREVQFHEFALSMPVVMIGSIFITWLVPESAINDLMFVLTPQLLKELHIEAITLRHSASPIASVKEMEVSIIIILVGCMYMHHKYHDEGYLE